MYRVNTPTVFILLVFAAVIQTAGLSYFNLLGAKPDLLFIITVFFSLYCVPECALKTAVMAGALKDITSSAIFGSYAVSFLIAALVLNCHQNRFFGEKPVTQALLAGVSYLLMCILALMLNLFSCKSFVYPYAFFGIIIKGAFYTGAVSPFVFFLASRIFKIRLAQNF